MKLDKSITLLLSALLLASCTEEAVQVTGLRAGISATLTRTWLDSEGGGTTLQVYWSDGDRINVNGQNSAPLSVSTGGKVSDAEFLLRSVTPPFNVIYPAEIVTGGAYDTEGRINITVPSTQEYRPGSFGNGAAVLYGWSRNADDGVQMNNLFAAVRVLLKGDAATVIDEATLSAGDEALAGVFSLTPKDGTLTPVEGVKQLSLNVGEGVNLATEGTWFYFAIPAKEYPGGLGFTFKQASDRRAMLCSWTPAEALKPGVLYSFSNVDFTPGAKDIESPDDWNEFAATINSGGDMGKWLRDGVVHLGADIEADDLTKVTANLTCEFDGQGHTITRTAATGALFRNIRGKVHDLRIAGTVTSTATTCGALSDSLYAGGVVSNCINDASVTVNAATYTRAGGFFGIVKGGTVSGCVNNGDVTVSADCSEATVLNLQAGGFSGQLDVTGSTGSDILLKDCVNTGAIVADPVCNIDESTYGITLAGIGGIAGWLRGNVHPFTLDNCDNSGTITYSAEHIKPKTGTKAYSVSVGGIVGIAGDINAAYGIYSTSVGDNGLDVTLTGCDNTGTVHNCGITASGGKNTNTKVYTGGIAGSLVGTAEKYAGMSACSNTGTILTYDIFGENAATTAPAYCHVAAGLIGYGGYVSIDGCTVNCTIGNGVRQSNAMAGCIGYAMRAFSVTNSTVWFNGLWTRVSGFNLNSGTVAVVPMAYSSTATSPLPDIKGSVIKNCSAGAKIQYYDASETDTSDRHASLSKSITLTAASTGSPNIVRGRGYNDGNTIRADISFENNTTLNEAP